MFKYLKNLVFNKKLNSKPELDEELKKELELNENVKENLALNEKLRDILAKLSSPLELNYNVKLLWYRKFYNNNKLLFLVNDEQFREVAFKRELWHSVGLLDRMKLLNPRERELGSFYKYRWFSPMDSLGFTYPDSAYIWGVQDGILGQVPKKYKKPFSNRSLYGMSVYYKSSDGIETFAFSSEESSTNLDTLYNAHFWGIKRFILYFKECLHTYIPDMEYKLLIDSPIDIREAVEHEGFIEDKHENFVKQTKLKNIRIFINKNTYKLTYKEAQCLSLLAQGKTSKEIAKKFKRAPKTIEARIDRLKLKLNVHTKIELLNIYSKSNLGEYLLVNREYEYTDEIRSYAPSFIKAVDGSHKKYPIK